MSLLVTLFLGALVIIELFLLIYLGFAAFANIQGAPFVHTSNLRLAQVLSLVIIPRRSKIVELGAGDGKVVVEFGKQGYSITGYEINPFLVLKARCKVNHLKLNSKCQVLWQSFWNVSLSAFDVIYVYGIPHIMDRLEKKIISECKPATYIISIGFHFKYLNKVTEENGVMIYSTA